MRPIVSLVLFTAAMTPALAQAPVELPTRRAGQWEIQVTTVRPAGAPAVTMQHCTDEATDRQMMQAGMQMNRDMCSRYEMKREGANYVIEATCRVNQTVSGTSRAEFSGDWQTTYSVNITGKIEGMPSGPVETQITQTARHVGPCRDGLTPGTIGLPNGMRLNVNDMMRMMQQQRQ